MPPSGPRSRPPQPPPSNRPPNASVRNEVFENIFGRPAGGHHMSGATVSAPPAPSGYGYNAYDQSSSSTYLNPAQPAFPPDQRSYASGQYVTAPPPRGASYTYAHQQYPQQTPSEGSYSQSQRNGYENGTYGRASAQGYSGGLAQVCPHSPPSS